MNEHGLEFFDVGGDPQELMSYMVKNPGLMPGMESLTNGDIGKKRKVCRASSIYAPLLMFFRCSARYETCSLTHVRAQSVL